MTDKTNAGSEKVPDSSDTQMKDSARLPVEKTPAAFAAGSSP
jgi:hypothetical protein